MIVCIFLIIVSIVNFVFRIYSVINIIIFLNILILEKLYRNIFLLNLVFNILRKNISYKAKSSENLNH